ncbi:MAG TPA: hypothetical protein VF765_30160 [Polyangiaceae bacterium]
MQTRHIAHVASLALALSVAGCTSSAVDAKAAHEAGQGTVRVFEATPQELWVASRAVLKWNPVGAVAEEQSGHYFVTDPKDFDQIGVWVDPVAAGKTQVTVVVIDDANLPGPDEQGVLKDIGAALVLERNGQPMDKRPVISALPSRRSLKAGG